MTHFFQIGMVGSACLASCVCYANDSLVDLHASNIASCGDFSLEVTASIWDEKSSSFHVTESGKITRVGDLLRCTTRILTYYDADGQLVSPDEPEKSDVSINLLTGSARELRGWLSGDPSLSEPGVNAKRHSSARGVIVTLDIEDRSPQSSILGWLLLYPDNFSTLATLSRRTDVSLQENPAEDSVTILSKDYDIKCTLSPQHGWLVGKAVCTLKNGVHAYTTNVVDYINIGGIAWLPRQATLEKDGREYVRVQTSNFRSGKDVARSEAFLDFPEGCRVDDLDNDTIHVWGSDDKPLQTFSDYAGYEKWALSAVGGDKISRSGIEEGSRSYLWLAVNIAAVALLVALIAARKRLART